MKLGQEVDAAAPVGPSNEAELENRCRHCGRPAFWPEQLVKGAHALCLAMRPLEEFLDLADDPTAENETQRYHDPVLVLFTMWGRVSRSEKEKIAHFVRCELAPINKLTAEMFLSGETAVDKDNQVRAFAAMRAVGLEAEVVSVFEEDDPYGFSGLSLDVHGISELRQHDWFWWLTDLLKPFDAHVETAGYVEADVKQADH